jgi:TolB protein
MAARPGRRTGWRNLHGLPEWRRALALFGLSASALAAGPRLETSPPELFAPGVASTQYSEVRLTLSPDGATALWFARDRPGGPGGYDIWMSRRSGASWGDATPVDFNSPQRDFDPAFSADGRFVYFCSDRPGGLGGDDIYRVPVTSSGFGTPEPLDGSINSPGNEWAPMLSRQNGLLFSSNGRGGTGRMDLFIAQPRGRIFSAAAPVSGALNSAADEFDATFLDDGKAILFSRAANLESDTVWLYIAFRKAKSYDAGTKLSESINVPDKSSYAPMIDWSQPDRFTFTRAGELYLARFRMKSP